MGSLRVLNVNGTDINKLLSTTKEFKPWHAFVSSWVSKPMSHREISWASLPCSLVSLSVVGCNLVDDAFPRDLSNLFSLKDLNIGNNPICGLPDCIKGLKTLRRLVITNCRKLQSLVGLPPLEDLEVSCCKSLERITFRSPLIELHSSLFMILDKIVVIQCEFKLEPIGKVHIEMVDPLGLFNLESMVNVEVNFLHGWLVPRAYIAKHLIQGLYENRIFSTFVPREEVPAGWCDNKINGSSISFSVPSLPSLRFRGFNVCCVYALSNNQHIWWPPPLFVKVNNKTKDPKWIYVPSSFAIPENGKDMIWLSHWKFGTKLEGGDEVNVSILVDVGFLVRECGIKLVYDQEEKIVAQDNEPYSSWPYRIGVQDYVPDEHGIVCLYWFPGLHNKCQGPIRDFDEKRREWDKYLHEEYVKATDGEFVEIRCFNGSSNVLMINLIASRLRVSETMRQ